MKRLLLEKLIIIRVVAVIKFFIFFQVMFLFLPSLKAQHEFKNGTADDFSDLFNEKENLELFSDFPRTFKNAPFPKAIPLNEQRLQLAERTGNQKGIATLSNNLGMIWLKRGDYNKSLDYLIKSLHARKAINDKKGLSLTAGAIGFVYQLTKEYDKALQYYYNAYELSKEQNLQRLTLNISALMGIVYMQKADTAFAGKHFNEAINGFSELGDKKSRANLYNKIGELYLQRNEFSKSLEYFNLSLKLKEELQDSPGKAIALRNMGIVLFKKGDYEKALEYFNKSLEFSKRLIVKKLIKDTYLKLAAVYSFRKEFDKADKYHSLYRELKDSLRNENLKQASADGMQQELSEKEKVIELLSRENEEQTKILNQQGLELSQQLTATEIERLSKEKALEELSLATIERKEKEKQVLLLSKQRAEQELQLSKKELELSRKTSLMNALIGGSLLILLLTFFIYNRYHYKKKSHAVLDKANAELTQTLEKLKSTQTQLLYSQKMASLGQLTAGIAHEIQNPLNFVNNFSDLSMELLDDLLLPATDQERKEHVDIIKQNLSKITHHGKRADNIVKNMLQHSRTGTQEKQLTDINKLAEEFINLSYHGMRATDMHFACSIEKNLDFGLPKANIVPQDIGRVLLNVLNNAFYAVKEKTKEAAKDYEPKVGISTRKQEDRILIKIMDNGNGIPDEIKDKIFTPFFSTKPTGEGTGIGLSLSYDIVEHGHGGTIRVESKKNAGSAFIIELPV